MNYKYITCKSALNKVNGNFPYQWDLNIYRGCYHSCQYCYALYSHKFIDEEADFFNNIFIKENIIEILEKKLSSKSWKKEIINIGSVCDSYQPIEAKTMLMRDVLKLMIKYQNPIVISTKSTLILRDIDLIKELASLTFVSVAFSINSTSDNLNRTFEQRAPSYIERFKALKQLKDTNAQVGLHMMPLIPYLSARKEAVESMFKLAKQIEVDYVLVGMMYLRSNTRKHFFSFIKDNVNDYYELLYTYYNNPTIKKAYMKEFYGYLSELTKKYSLNVNPKNHKLVENEQLSLF